MFAIQNWEKISGAVFVAGIVIGLLVLTGCTATPTTALYQSIGADRAAVQSATTLYQTGTIDKPTALTIAQGATGAEAALKLWYAAIQAKDAGGVATQQGAVTADLTALLAQLEALTAQPKVAAKLKLSAKYNAKMATATSVSDYIAIIQLAVALAPEIESWVDNILSTTTVTPDMVTQAFAELDSANATLAAALNPPVVAP